MHWAEIKMLNTNSARVFLKERFNIDVPEEQDRDISMARILIEFQNSGKPVDGVPAYKLVELGLAPALGVNPGDSDAPDEDGEDPAPVRAKYIRRAVITLHPGENSGKFEKVAVNGRAIQIAYEKKAAIPWEHYMVLESAVQGMPRKGADGAIEGYEDIRRFNYTFHGEVWTDITGKVVKPEVDAQTTAA